MLQMGKRIKHRENGIWTTDQQIHLTWVGCSMLRSDGRCDFRFEVQRAALELSGRAEKCIVLSNVLREKDEEEEENVAVNQY